MHSHLASCHNAKCSWKKIEAKDGDKERRGGGDPGLGKKKSNHLSFKKNIREREKTERKRERKERNRERKERIFFKGETFMSRVNYYQSAFNSQRERLNILAEMLEISKSGGPYIIDHRHYKSSCRS